MFKALREKLRNFGRKVEEVAEETSPAQEPSPSAPPPTLRSEPAAAAPTTSSREPTKAERKRLLRSAPTLPPPSSPAQRQQATVPPPAPMPTAPPVVPRRATDPVVLPPPKVKKVARAVAPDTTSAAFTDSLLGLRIRPERLLEVLAELEMALLECDVALPVVEVFKADLMADLVGRKVRLRTDLESLVRESLKRSIHKVLHKGVDFDRFVANAPKPLVLMFVGINGTGKTTAIGRIAYRLQQQGYSVVMAAADTFRAGAIEQLDVHATRLGTKIIKHQEGSDPAAVAFDAVEHAKARKRDIVLVDTAGRMQTNTNLMMEMKKIKRVCKPHKIIFVGDALAGNDAVDQAVRFHEAVGVDWAILTKIDCDSKGGAALSIASAIDKPIILVGTGQQYADLELFDADWMVRRIFSEDTAVAS